jgi:hypothetical protein
VIFTGDYATRRWGVRLELPEGVVLANLEGPILVLERGLAQAPQAGAALSSERLSEGTELLAWTLANNHMMDYGPRGCDGPWRRLGPPEWRGAGRG